MPNKKGNNTELHSTKYKLIFIKDSDILRYIYVIFINLLGIMKFYKFKIKRNKYFMRRMVETQ